MSERGVGVPERLSTEALFRLHAPFVARLLYRLGVHAAEIDDVLQEVFLVVHRYGGYVRGAATPTSYLGAIAVKAAASARRRTQTNERRQGEPAPDQLATLAQNPVELAQAHQTMRQLDAALAQLDPDLRVPFVLIELEGESCLAVAASLGIPIGTVYWRLHRARKKFHAAAQRAGVAAWLPSTS